MHAYRLIMDTHMPIGMAHEKAQLNYDTLFISTLSKIWTTR